MSAEPAGTTNFKVESKDGQQFDISYLAMKHSKTLKDLARSDGYDSTKPIKVEVDEKSLKRIVDWCHKHAEEDVYVLEMKGPKNMVIPQGDVGFIPIYSDELFNFIVAADYLKTDKLLDYASKKVALMGYGKTPNEMRAIYGIRDVGAEEPMVVEAPAEDVEAPAEIVEAPVENVVAEQRPRTFGKKNQKKK
ncbi:hypothetical protein GCK72_016953 [Caenorhabditis remanei]|uniref:SKP1 component POZ domain-containing protein n=1 Tax=Caenorhabditis remanei TaxID=31234 RepID=A0A6A5G6I4_CAERE|nr:hypothetical protein GCK72_016953 [Caenorhabditis remanei]KAF1750403.1 hypothetical protein GCK72_016953 [Caenorhabditis remanei]